MKIKNNTTC